MELLYIYIYSCCTYVLDLVLERPRAGNGAVRYDRLYLGFSVLAGISYLVWNGIPVDGMMLCDMRYLVRHFVVICII